MISKSTKKNRRKMAFANENRARLILNTVDAGVDFWLLDRLNFTIKRDNILALHCYDAIVRETDQVIRREHGYGLIDLVLSFAGIHPRKPDLFYSHELVVLK